MCRGGGKGILIQNEKTGALATHPQSVCFEPKEAYGVVTKGNGDAFINPNTHMALSVGGGQAGQGYPCVMEEEPVLLANNQNMAEVSQTGICNTLPASAGMGGGYVPMVAYGMDSYNQTADKEVAETLRTNGGGDSSPKVCITDDPISFQGQAGVEASLQLGKDVSPTLCHGKTAMVSYGLDRASFNQGQNAKFDFSVEEEISPTLVNRGPGGVLAKQ